MWHRKLISADSQSFEHLGTQPCSNRWNAHICEISNIIALHFCTMEVHTCTYMRTLHNVSMTWSQYSHGVDGEGWTKDDSVSCFKFLYLLLAARSLILFSSSSDDVVASSWCLYHFKQCSNISAAWPLETVVAGSSWSSWSFMLLSASADGLTMSWIVNSENLVSRITWVFLHPVGDVFVCRIVVYFLGEWLDALLLDICIFWVLI